MKFSNCDKIDKMGIKSDVSCVEFEEAIKKCKFGKFNYILILLSGGLMACGFFELTSVNFILPLAQCDFDICRQQTKEFSALSDMSE